MKLLGEMLLLWAAVLLLTWAVSGCAVKNPNSILQPNAGSVTIIPPDPKNPPQMYTYTTNGYKMIWWIFEEFDGSCMIEYSIYGPKDRTQSLAHGALPCQMMAMFFHSIQPRKQNEVPKAPDLQSPPHSDHD